MTSSASDPATAAADVIDLGSVRQDDESFQALFASTYPRLVRTVELVVGSRAVAEEIAQDAFVQLFLRWRRVGGYDRPDLWLRRVAVRDAVRERRRSRRRLELERVPAGALRQEPDHGTDPDVLRAIATLGPKQRAIVALFYYLDRPMTEIAEILGCSESTGWSQLHHARRRLAELLHEEVPDDVG
ncbi:MAG: sigma-70 family RNA polymerase sigma factor [Nocardioidaceae bacterium]